jgi:CheY-like chemotaxis protein
MATATLTDEMQAPADTAPAAGPWDLARREGRDSGRLRSLRILVVDDNPTTAFCMADTLVRWQARPMLVEDGRAALAALERGILARRPFAAVLVDAHLDGEDGWDLAAAILGRPELAGTRVLVLGPPGEDPSPARDVEVHGRLTKPAREGDLWTALHEALRPVAADQEPAVASR